MTQNCVASVTSTINSWDRMARCREMATLPAGYIPQHKVSLVSSNWVSFCVCSVVGWLIVYRLGTNQPILQPIKSVHLLTRVRCLPKSQEHCSSIRAQLNSLNRRPPRYCIVCPLLQTNNQDRDLEKFPLGRGTLDCWQGKCIHYPCQLWGWAAHAFILLGIYNFECTADVHNILHLKLNFYLALICCNHIQFVQLCLPQTFQVLCAGV